MPDTSRAIELAVDVQAVSHDVWRALTVAEEIPRWFAPFAEVEPGPGGFIEISWGPGMTGRNRIEVWEPAQHLVLASDEGGLREEYRLTEDSGRTQLHLVHSGFPQGPEADAQFDSISNGWRTFFSILQHQMKQIGKPYRNVTAFTTIPASRAVVWDRLMQPGGLARDRIGSLQAGSRFDNVLSIGRRFTGTVVHAAIPGYLVVADDTADQSIFALFCERGGEENGVESSMLTGTWILNGDAIKAEAPLRADWSRWVQEAQGKLTDGLQPQIADVDNA